MGLLSVSSTISCSSRAMEGAMGVRLDRQRRIMPFLFRQVRIHLSQGATPLRLAIRTISNLTGAALSIRQRDLMIYQQVRRIDELERRISELQLELKQREGQQG